MANCLVNTDFYLPRGVVIKKNADTIIFENPGNIRTGKTQMLRGGISDPKNESIFKLIKLNGRGERAASGGPDIFATWKQQGWKEPTVEEQYGPDRTILTLSFVSNSEKVINESASKVQESAREVQEKSKESYDLSEQQQQVYAYMKEHDQITAAEVEALLQVKRRRAVTILNDMIGFGIVKRVGTSRASRYTLQG